jgi:hypothetical protein
MFIFIQTTRRLRQRWYKYKSLIANLTSKKDYLIVLYPCLALGSAELWQRDRDLKDWRTGA